MEKDRIVGVLRAARGIRKSKKGNNVAVPKPGARDTVAMITSKKESPSGQMKAASRASEEEPDRR
jgi:hypothetical protein